MDHHNAINVKNLWTKFTAGLEYGWSDRLTLRGETNFQFNEREEGVKNNYYEAHGLGDLLLGARYWFRDLDLGGWNVFLGLDVRCPTGDDDDQWKGAYKKAYIIPGSGQWGLLPSLGFYKGFGDFALVGAGGGVFSTGKSGGDYESADVGHAAVGLTWTPLKLGKSLVGGSLFVTAIWIPGNDQRNGITVGNTGGEWYNLVPGLYFSPDGGNTTLYLSVPLTVAANVHDLQCYETYAVSAGVQIRF